MTSKASSADGFDAVVVGAGVIGLATAREIARDGGRVALVDRAEPGEAASRVAAGMLAPVAEAAFGEERLLEMTLAAARAYPEFVAGLEAETGRELGYSRCGALHIALDRDEAAELHRRREFLTSLGLEPEWLGPSGCRDLEPGLTPSFHGGIRVPEEAAIDPRSLTRALAASVDSAAGAELCTGRAANGLIYESGTLRGVRLSGGEELRAGNVVLATGAWAGAAEWLPAEARPPVRPVKGQILELGPRSPLAGGATGSDSAEPLARGVVATERIYLVPRPDGRLVAGATVEEQGFDVAVTAGGIYELLREAHRALPDLAELELLETTAGLRPATPDNLPLVGPGAIEGLHLATGHYRNGVLLAPLTARAVVDRLAGREVAGPIAAADPARFAGAAAATAHAPATEAAA